MVKLPSSPHTFIYMNDLMSGSGGENQNDFYILFSRSPILSTYTTWHEDDDGWFCVQGCCKIFICLRKYNNDCNCNDYTCTHMKENHDDDTYFFFLSQHLLYSSLLPRIVIIIIVKKFSSKLYNFVCTYLFLNTWEKNKIVECCIYFYYIFSDDYNDDRSKKSFL